MGKVRDGAPSQWDCVVFTTIARFKNKKKAVEHLATEHNESISTKGVESILRKIDGWIGEDAFTEGRKGSLELTVRGKRFLRFANKIVATYEEERMPTSQRSLPKIVCLPHHVYITSLLECHLREQDPNHEDQITVEELGHSDRSDDGFEDEALFPLTLGHHAIAIGGKGTTDKEDLQSDLLYTARLEVMVPSSYEPNQMSITELVTNHRALLAPETARSRKLLERRIAEKKIDAPPKEQRIAAETYEITMSVQRTSDDHRQFGAKSRRVVVAASDVALLYKPGYRFGGSGTDHSRRIPLHHDGEQLKLGVYATTVNPRPKHIRPLVDLLREICSKHPDLSGT
ncbi:hypothetical protein GCM10027290_44920 [Micromonospora sonneratiae]|uniref:Uncharacterized protein n=1 Tax=Micromonospora sonneratiae TaxID=1184706 RepID=A0ABW3Y6W9_9ACTN